MHPTTASQITFVIPSLSLGGAARSLVNGLARTGFVVQLEEAFELLFKSHLPIRHIS